MPLSRAHLYSSINLGVLDVAAGVEGAADFFYDVYKYFVSPTPVGPACVEHRLDDSCWTPGCPRKQIAFPSSLHPDSD